MGPDEVIFYARLCARLAQRHTDREGALDFHGLDAAGFDRLERGVLDALAEGPASERLRLLFAQTFVAARASFVATPASDEDSLSTTRWPRISAHPVEALDTVDGSEDDSPDAAALLDVMETLHSPGNKPRSPSG